MNTIKLPRIAVYVFALMFLVLVYFIMKTLSFYLIPATLAGLLAMLMLPLNRKLESWRIPRLLAIIISLLIILAIISGIITIISTQVLKFAKDLPTIQQQLTGKFQEFQQFIQKATGITAENQMNFIDKEVASIISSADQWATGILVATGGTLAVLGY